MMFSSSCNMMFATAVCLFVCCYLCFGKSLIFCCHELQVFVSRKNYSTTIPFDRWAQHCNWGEQRSLSWRMPICQTHPQISGAHSSTTTKLQYSELAFFKATVLALSLSSLSWDSSSSTTSFSFSSSEFPAANSELCKIAAIYIGTI